MSPVSGATKLLASLRGGSLRAQRRTRRDKEKCMLTYEDICSVQFGALCCESAPRKENTLGYMYEYAGRI